MEAVQVALISVVGLALGWDPAVGGVAVVVTVLLGTAAFAALGLLLAGVLRAEATLAAANLVYLLLLAGGGVVLPTSSYGAAGRGSSGCPRAHSVRRCARLSPTAAPTSRAGRARRLDRGRHRPDRQDLPMGVTG